MQRRLRGRVAIGVGVLLGCFLLLIAPASAKMVGSCDGKVTIEGVEYTADNDTRDNPIIVPKNRDGLPIVYEGSVGFTNTNYLGAVGIIIGPSTINVADWGLDENEADVRERSPSTYTLGSQVDNIIGIYQLTAFHDADGGNCDADAWVKFEGGLTDSPIAMGAAGGVVVTGVGLVAAGRPKGRS